MSISITAFTPNTQIKSSEVNTNFTNLKNGVIDASYRAFTWGLLDVQIVGDELGMKYIVPQNLTINKVWYKLDAGTATLRIQKDTTDIVNSLTATTSLQSTTSFSSSTVTAGQVLTLDLTAASSCSGVYVVLECQVTSIA